MQPLPKGETLDWLSRGLKASILEEFGAFSPYFPGSENPRRAVVFPSYDPKTTKLCGWTLRDLEGEERDGTKKGNVFTEGTRTLFGQQRVPLGADTVCIVEGEVDAITVASVMPKWCVICLPGATTTRLIRESLPFIRGFKKIVICMDNDEAGHQAEGEIVSMLPTYKTFVVKLTRNDPNDYLQANDASSLVSHLRNAKCIRSSALTTKDQYTKDLALDDLDEGFDTGIAPLNDMLGNGLHPTELFVIGGYTGIGKSQLGGQLAYNLATLNADTKVLYVGTEMSHRQMMRKLSQIHLGRRFYDKTSVVPVTAEEKQTAGDFIYDHMVFNTEGLTDPKTFYDEAVVAILTEGVRVIFVDVLSDFDQFSDWKKAIDIMEMLKKLADGDTRENIPPAAVVVISHTTGKDEGLTLDALRGGSAIRQKATCVAGINGERDSNVRTIMQLKMSRNFSLGITAPFDIEYEHLTTRYTYNGSLETPNMEGTQIRQHDRTFSASELPDLSTPSNVIPLRAKDRGETVQLDTTELNGTESPNRVEQLDMSQIHARLPHTGDTDLSRSEGTTDDSRPNEAVSSDTTEPRNDLDTVTPDVQPRPSVAEYTRLAEQGLRVAPTSINERYVKRSAASAVVSEEPVRVHTDTSPVVEHSGKRPFVRRVNRGA